MPREYTKKEFWELYERLPQELRDALFAKETESNIRSVCERNDVMKNHENIVDYVGQVLIGLLPPDDFREALEKELKLEKEVARRVAREIYRFIFSSVKTDLEELYKEKVEPSVSSSGLSRTVDLLKKTSSKASESEEGKRERAEETREDLYRESVD
jgi:hypothetical protein